MDKQNEKTNELTREQMGQISGGEELLFEKRRELLSRSQGTDCFYCPGTLLPTNERCGRVLQQVSGKLYRCTNPHCRLFTLDQYPSK